MYLAVLLLWLHPCFACTKCVFMTNDCRKPKQTNWGPSQQSKERKKARQTEKRKKKRKREKKDIETEKKRRTHATIVKRRKNSTGAKRGKTTKTCNQVPKTGKIKRTRQATIVFGFACENWTKHWLVVRGFSIRYKHVRMQILANTKQMNIHFWRYSKTLSSLFLKEKLGWWIRREKIFQLASAINQLMQSSSLD